jgi:hypothetical protein
MRLPVLLRRRRTERKALRLARAFAELDGRDARAKPLPPAAAGRVSVARV